MAGFIRRFNSFPAFATLTSIESVNIIDLIPPGVFVGRSTGALCLVGEWPEGPYNTPTRVEGTQTIQNHNVSGAPAFGGFSLGVTNPLSFSTNPFSNGNAYCWLKAKKFSRLVLVRANLELTGTVTITLGGTPTPTDREIVIPGGTRIRNPGTPTQEFALADPVIFAEGTVIGSGPQAYTRGVAQTQAQITGVPVFSTQGNTAAGVGSVTQVDATDLQRAGIGAGTPLPNHTVVATNPAALTVLTSGQIDTAYQNAIDSTLPGTIDAADDIEIIASARQSSAIRTRLASNAADASAVGTGRVALLRAPIGTNLTSASGAADPGVGANRSDRVIYCYPHFEQNIPELAELDAGESISAADILIGADAAMGTILSLLSTWKNPGQSTRELVSGGLLNQFVRDLESGLTSAGQPTNFTLANYETMLASGIACLRRDPRIAEWVFQSGVTAVDPSIYPSLAPIKRRRHADFLQDSMAAIALGYNKLVRTEDREDNLLGDLVGFLEVQKSEDNPPAATIVDYSIDITSGNSTELQGAGIYVIIIEVQMLDDFRFIALQTTIGETVTVSSPDLLAA